MSKYRKKPVVIDAVQYLGLSEPVIEALDIPADQVAFTETGGLLLRTLESGKGHHFVADGDWIIKGVAGEFYPCKPEIFAKTYEDAFAVPEGKPTKLWLWKNFVDGRPEYWAFDNPYPTYGGGDPMTLGEPCGYAIFKESTVAPGRKDVPEAEVIADIKRAQRSPQKE